MKKECSECFVDEISFLCDVCGKPLCRECVKHSNGDVDYCSDCFDKFRGGGKIMSDLQFECEDCQRLTSGRCPKHSTEFYFFDIPISGDVYLERMGGDRVGTKEIIIQQWRNNDKD